MKMILGPCAIESKRHALKVAKKLWDIQFNVLQYLRSVNHPSEDSFEIIYKSSYSKANRTSKDSYAGIGIDKGLKILKEIKDKYGFRVTSDVHSVEEIQKAKDVLDIIQIPHQMCRNTAILEAAAKTGKIVSVKKGTFMKPEDVCFIVDKIRRAGNMNEVIIIERGNNFGYGNTVVDMRNFEVINRDILGVLDHTVTTCIDATHPSCGSYFAPGLAKAGVAAGAQMVFLETHDDPDYAPCDGPCMINLKDLQELLIELQDIYEVVNKKHWERRL
jgi:2-dehydro-3-deoxyphosphooctonate aldolase (KDO 8-P synthase)